MHCADVKVGVIVVFNLFNKKQRSTLEDYKETALMMRHNKLQRHCGEEIVVKFLLLVTGFMLNLA